MLKDIIEKFWTGQEVEIKPGPNVSQPAFCLEGVGLFEDLDKNLFGKVGDILNQYYDEQIIRLNLGSLSMMDGVHELEFNYSSAPSAYYLEGPMRDLTIGARDLTIGAEIRASGEENELYHIKMFIKNGLSGNRFVFMEKPSDEVLKSFEVMYKILQRLGYIAETTEAVVSSK